MAKFIGNYTKQGLALLGKSITGGNIEITRVVIGDGKLDDEDDIYELTSVKNPVEAKAVYTGYSVIEENQVSLNIRIQCDEKEFVCREIGIMAKDKNNSEILYQYANCGENAIHFAEANKDLFYYDISFISVFGTEPDITVPVELKVEVFKEDFDREIGKLKDVDTAMRKDFDNLVNALEEDQTFGDRKLNELNSLHHLTNYNGTVYEAYFQHELTADEKKEKYVSMYKIFNEIGCTGDMNKVAVVMFSGFTSQGGMCIIDTYGKTYMQNNDIHFDSSDVDILYGTMRILVRESN